jgi:hypothetical protein
VADSSETLGNIYQTAWRHIKSVPCFCVMETEFINNVYSELHGPNGRLVSAATVRNVAVGWVAILFRILEALGSNPSVSPGTCWGCT